MRPPKRTSAAAAADGRDSLEQAALLHGRGQLDQAEAVYRRIVAAQPDNGAALHLLGLLRQQQGDLDGAVALIERALATAPDMPSFHLSLARLRIEQDRINDAHIHLTTVLARRPDDPDALFALGVAFTRLGRPEAAVRTYRLAVAARPDFALAHANIGSLLHKLGDEGGAAEALDRALAIDPSNAASWYNRAVVAQAAEDDPARAIAWYGRALALVPDYRRALSNRGVALMEAGRLGAAVRDFDAVLADHPDEPEAMWNKALAVLVGGDLAAGWPLYRWRWRRPGAPVPLYRPAQPLWTGAEDVAGRSMFIFAEQGLGDTVQFCRYGLLLRAAGARVVMAVQPDLVPLLAGAGVADQVIAIGAPVPDVDFHCPLLDLPGAFATTLSTIPAPSPYLFADPARVRAWGDRLGPRPPARPRVGLVWRGSASHANDRNRSMALDLLVSALSPDCDSPLSPACDYVALQRDLVPAEVATLARAGIVILGDALSDFAETAAACAQLDLIITVDTSVAHLAGALGRPCWVLLPYSPDWRWLLGRVDTPWYPTTRLYRQAAPGAWGPVLDRVGTDLRRATQHQPAQFD